MPGEWRLDGVQVNDFVRFLVGELRIMIHKEYGYLLRGRHWRRSKSPQLYRLHKDVSSKDISNGMERFTTNHDRNFDKFSLLN